MIKSFINWWCKHFVFAIMIIFSFGLIVGFVLGIYFLPILVADAPVEATIIEAEQSKAKKQAVLMRDLEGSDGLHWGEGTLLFSDERVTLMGELAPGPDYKLYLTPEYADTGEKFLAIKDASLSIASIKGFKDFSYLMPAGVDLSDYNSVVIWCESFSKFISAGELTDRP